MRKCIAILLTLFLFAANALADSFFPTMDELFGVTLPSAAYAVNREPSAEESTDEGVTQTYSPFDDFDYEALSKYLSGAGVKLIEFAESDGAAEFTLEKDGAQFTLVYDRNQRTAVLHYPAGTRIEQEAGTSGSTPELPSLGDVFGAELPSLDHLLHNPSVEELGDGRTAISYSGVTEDEYTAVSRFLYACGCTLISTEAQGGAITATLGLDGDCFEFHYDNTSGDASVTYPILYHIGEFEETVASDSPGLLPDAETAFGIFVPTVRNALQREATKTERGEGGVLREVYQQFTDEDYNAFSQYLQGKECSVVSYSEENGVITIHLEKSGKAFDLEYDRRNHTMTQTYPEGTRPEATPTPAPTPVPTPSPASAPKATAIALMSETRCWDIAKTYFENLSWKDPSSLQIHSHTATWDYSNGTCTFIVDYSARNGFGGMNREYYYIEVDAVAGKVTSAFGT